MQEMRLHQNTDNQINLKISRSPVSFPVWSSFAQGADKRCRF